MKNSFTIIFLSYFLISCLRNSEIIPSFDSEYRLIRVEEKTLGGMIDEDTISQIYDYLYNPEKRLKEEFVNGYKHREYFYNDSLLSSVVDYSDGNPIYETLFQYVNGFVIKVQRNFLQFESPPRITFYEEKDDVLISRDTIVKEPEIIVLITRFSLNKTISEWYRDGVLFDQNSLEIKYSIYPSFYGSFGLPRRHDMLAYRPVGVSAPAEILQIASVLPKQIIVNGNPSYSYIYYFENNLVERVTIIDHEFDLYKETFLTWERN